MLNPKKHVGTNQNIKRYINSTIWDRRRHKIPIYNWELLNKRENLLFNLICKYYGDNMPKRQFWRKIIMRNKTAIRFRYIYLFLLFRVYQLGIRRDIGNSLFFLNSWGITLY